MPINTHDIIEACNLIATQEHLNVCLTESLKGASLAGIGAFAAGALFGPVGIAVGGAVGGLAGARYAKKYVPLVQILASLTEEDKTKLADHMLRVVNSLDITDALMLMSVIGQPEAIARKAIVSGLASYYGENW